MAQPESNPNKKNQPEVFMREVWHLSYFPDVLVILLAYNLHKWHMAEIQSQ